MKRLNELSTSSEVSSCPSSHLIPFLITNVTCFGRLGGVAVQLSARPGSSWVRSRLNRTSVSCVGRAYMTTPPEARVIQSSTRYVKLLRETNVVAAPLPKLIDENAP